MESDAKGEGEGWILEDGGDIGYEQCGEEQICRRGEICGRREGNGEEREWMEEQRRREVVFESDEGMMREMHVPECEERGGLW